MSCGPVLAIDGPTPRTHGHGHRRIGRRQRAGPSTAASPIDVYSVQLCCRRLPQHLNRPACAHTQERWRLHRGAVRTAVRKVHARAAASPASNRPALLAKHLRSWSGCGRSCCSPSGWRSSWPASAASGAAFVRRSCEVEVVREQWWVRRGWQVATSTAATPTTCPDSSCPLAVAAAKVTGWFSEHVQYRSPDAGRSTTPAIYDQPTSMVQPLNTNLMSSSTV